MDSAAIKPGVILAGKYQVERVLGRGGMGVVLAARHMFMARPVAIKLMTAVGMGGAEQEARFVREAQIAGMLKGEHAGKVWDCGKLEDGTPFIEMELLEGKDLAGVLKLRGAMTIEEAVSYVLEASEAVAEAHALGIVHRDLKPANLFLAKVPGTTKNCVKVLDFGISKVQSGDDAKLTRTGQMFGSPPYMSPEQVQSTKSVDGRTDVWSLGVILYEFLSETTPFAQDSTYATMSAVVLYPPKPLATLRPDLPPGLVEAIMRCLQKNADLRFQNVPAFAEALGPYAPQEMKRYVEQIAKAGRVKPAAALNGAPPSGAGDAPVPRPAAESASALTPPPGSGATLAARGRGAVAIGAVVGAIAAGSVTAAVLLTRSGDTSASALPSSSPSAVASAPLAQHERPPATPSAEASAPVVTPAPSTRPSATGAPSTPPTPFLSTVLGSTTPPPHTKVTSHPPVAFPATNPIDMPEGPRR